MKAIEILALDATEPDNQRWKALVEQYAKTAASFEIHCWNEETEWIALALQYGNYKQTDWAFGKIVSGSVTPEFLQMLLGLPKPTDTEIYNKMTPFFSIFFDNGFPASITEPSCMFVRALLVKTTLHFREFWRMMRKKDFSPKGDL